MYQIELLFICSTGIFSDRETLELLAASISFEGLLPRLNLTWFYIVCGTVPLEFIYDYRKFRRLAEPYFVSSGWMSHSVCMCGLPHISSNFPVELSHLILCDCPAMFFHFFWNYKPPYFLFFYTLSLCYVDCYNLLPLFLSRTGPLFFVIMSHKYLECLYYLCVNVICVRLHFLCVNVK